MSGNKETIVNGPVHNEDLEHAATHGTYLDKEEASHLSEEHRQYLLQRHGTIELDPLPTMGDADPYNWPTWKVTFHHAPFMSTLANTFILESPQSNLRRLPCLHVRLCRLSHHSCL